LGERVGVRGMGSTLYPLTFILSPSSGGEENVSGVVGQPLAGRIVGILRSFSTLK